MLKKIFLTSILVLGALLPLTTLSHDASLATNFTSKVLLLSERDAVERLERNEHTYPVPQLQTHKRQQLLYSKLQSTDFITFELKLVKLQSLDSKEREVLNALRQDIFLCSRFQRAPPTQNHNIL